MNTILRPSGEGKLRIVLPEVAKLYTTAAFGLTPGKGLVVTDTPVQVTFVLIFPILHRNDKQIALKVLFILFFSCCPHLKLWLR